MDLFLFLVDIQGQLGRLGGFEDVNVLDVVLVLGLAPENDQLVVVDLGGSVVGTRPGDLPLDDRLEPECGK